MLAGSVIGCCCEFLSFGLRHVPVFINGTDIEMDGKCFEDATRCCWGVRWYQMHSVFVGNLMAGSRLN